MCEHRCGLCNERLMVDASGCFGLVVVALIVLWFGIGLLIHEVYRLDVKTGTTPHPVIEGLAAPG